MRLVVQALGLWWFVSYSMMSLFKKYLIDNDCREIINAVNLYHEIDVYHKTDPKPKTKKDIQVTSILLRLAPYIGFFTLGQWYIIFNNSPVSGVDMYENTKTCVHICTSVKKFTNIGSISLTFPLHTYVIAIKSLRVCILLLW